MTSQKKLLDYATSIVETLIQSGHKAYFAGGFVRDKLLGLVPTEIDIATSASPETVSQLFPKTLLVGAQFGVVVVVLGGHNFEVATFRSEEGYVDGRHPTHVYFACPKEDAKRRDFTINGLFYDPLNQEILDFVEGQADLQKKILRAIGRPEERFFEDRLRMLRAVRFATRFNLKIEENTRQAIIHHASTLLPAVSMERVWQELQKMLLGPHPDSAILMLHRLGLLQTIFPDLQSVAIDELEAVTAHYSRFPKSCPPILYLHVLVPQLKADICRYLKASNADVKLVETYLKYPQSQDLVEWVHFYALKDAKLSLQVRAAFESEDFLPYHLSQMQKLHLHIERVILKHPLVCAEALKAHGIIPGPQMGELLRQAERIAIEHDLHSAQDVLKKLF